jgi:hypothetical protein
VVVERRLRWSAGRPTIGETWDGDTPRIRSRCGEATRCTVAYTLRVPADVEIDARTRASRIEARGLTGSLRLTGSSGAVTATGLRQGPVEIGADPGDIDLRFASPPGILTVTPTPTA